MSIKQKLKKKNVLKNNYVLNRAYRINIAAKRLKSILGEVDFDVNKKDGSIKMKPLSK